MGSWQHEPDLVKALGAKMPGPALTVALLPASMLDTWTQHPGQGGQGHRERMMLLGPGDHGRELKGFLGSSARQQVLPARSCPWRCFLV